MEEPRSIDRNLFQIVDRSLFTPFYEKRGFFHKVSTTALYFTWLVPFVEFLWANIHRTSSSSIAGVYFNIAYLAATSTSCSSIAKKLERSVEEWTIVSSLATSVIFTGMKYPISVKECYSNLTISERRIQEKL